MPRRGHHSSTRSFCVAREARQQGEPLVRSFHFFYRGMGSRSGWLFWRNSLGCLGSLHLRQRESNTSGVLLVCSFAFDGCPVAFHCMDPHRSVLRPYALFLVAHDTAHRPRHLHNGGGAHAKIWTPLPAICTLFHRDVELRARHMCL